MPRQLRSAIFAVAALAAAYVLLCVPMPERAPAAAPARGGAFAWDRDAYWRSLEGRFADARAAGCATVSPRAARALARLGARITALDARALPPEHAAFDTITTAFFELAPEAAVCPEHERDYIDLAGRWREAVKRQSRAWDVRTTPARERLYVSLYGARAAVEEVMIQHPDTALARFVGSDAPSATPSAVVRGVTLHSGDIIVSRGGYPTSALIARGNDYPGNFSHVALVHVDSATHAVRVIEAHIERGVAISTPEQYLADKKLRLMLLRPRADLPAIAADPMLPHRAATAMLARALAGHIPYDFAMDYQDPSALFCSEVASAAYHARGVDLWTGLSTISAPAVRRWLSYFGVRHFETQEPSDLEYDPQLVVVAEWRDPVQLLRDHIDNATIDAMLERAAAGKDLPLPVGRLGLFRLAKAWSWLLNRFGRVGRVPEGMSAQAALRHTVFMERERRIAERVRANVDALTATQGYPPPYWALIELARASAGAVP